MAFSEIGLMQDMTAEQRMLFTTQFAAARKNGTTGVLLALFLGGFGAHKFYLGQTGQGIFVRAVLLDLHPSHRGVR